MSEKPILFSAPMVRAILDGSKTQTRRIVKPTPTEPAATPWWKNGWLVPERCPYGQPGDRLWVRETWGAPFDACKPSEIPAGNLIIYRADYGDGGKSGCKLWPSTFMPRWASRITLEVTGVRVERLQDITAGDCRAEGHPVNPQISDQQQVHDDAARDWYMDLWEAINGPGSWDANPWVWVIEFKRITP